jgi:hypothetical protein
LRLYASDALSVSDATRAARGTHGKWSEAANSEACFMDGLCHRFSVACARSHNIADLGEHVRWFAGDESNQSCFSKASRWKRPLRPSTRTTPTWSVRPSAGQSWCETRRRSAEYPSMPHRRRAEQSPLAAGAARRQFGRPPHVLSRSRVLRAKRSSRVTVNTSPSESLETTLRNSARSDLRFINVNFLCAKVMIIAQRMAPAWGSWGRCST